MGGLSTNPYALAILRKKFAVETEGFSPLMGYPINIVTPSESP